MSRNGAVNTLIYNRDIRHNDWEEEKTLSLSLDMIIFPENSRELNLILTRKK